MEHRRIVILAALALAACATAEPEQIRRQWSYSIDTECLDPSQEQLAALDEAAELWESYGVTIAPGSDGAHFSLCFMRDEPSPGRPGLTFQHGDRGWIDVGPPPPCGLAPVVLAHEIGHLVLPGTGHLPDGEHGIMSAIIDCTTQPQWSESDIEHFSAIGL